MSCSHDDRLLDLVMGEIPAEDAAALRAEALECPHCHDALAQLELGAALAARMPMEEPPAAMDVLIMKAAREKAEAMASERAKVAPAVPDAAPASAAEPPAAEALTTWERLKQWASGITLGPQLAMASVMVLVVSIGLFYLPEGGGDTVARTAVTPDPEGEAMSALPDPSMAPADSHLPGEEPEAAVAVEESDEVDGDDVERPTAFAREDRVAGSLGYGGSNRDRADRQQNRNTERQQWQPEAEAEAAPAPSPRQRQAARTEARQAAVPNEDPLPSFEGSVAQNAGVPPSAGVPSAPSAPSTQAGSSYEAGVGSYRGGRYREAEEELEDAMREAPSRDILPNSVHQLARSYRQQNDCQNAVTHYQDLLQRFPSYAQLPQAMIEAADCQRRLGRLRQARTLLERAQRYASTRATASRELQRIETLERASRRRAAPAAVDAYEAAEAY